MQTQIRGLLIVFSLFTECLIAVPQEYSTSIVGTDFDIITDEDPSCLVGLVYKGVDSVEMPDKTREAELFQNAHVFVASYSDRTKIRIAIDLDIGAEQVSTTEALRYATRLGKLPRVLREGVKRVVVHEGNENATAFSDAGLIVVYSGNASKRISTHDLEETLFHESVHATWDRKYANAPEWLRAQAADGSFATLYAKKNPSTEDLAESALFAYAVLHHPDRLPAVDLKRFQAIMPARVQFFEKLMPIE